MIVAGIHGGNEYNTIQLADQLISHLNAHPETIPSNVRLYILRSLNPDGEARAKNMYGRANDHGVDLNHNFPINWQKDWDRDGCWRYLHLNGGISPASEPETRALMDFLLAHKVDALISYHSAALGIFPGGEPPDPASVSLAEAVAEVSHYPYPAIDTGCEFTGSLPDWAVSRGIAALDVELTNHQDTDFKQNLAILSVFLNWEH
jgi:predicted deacylase